DCIQAMKLEPDSGLIAYTAAIAHYWAGDPDTAAELIDRSLELEPKAVFAHWVRALIFSVKGDSTKKPFRPQCAQSQRQVTIHCWSRPSEQRMPVPGALATLRSLSRN